MVSALFAIGVGQREGEAIRTIDGGGIQRLIVGHTKVGVGLKQLEGEALVRYRRPVTTQGLAAGNGGTRTLSAIGVDQADGGHVLRRSDYQSAVLMADGHGDGVHRLIVDNAGEIIVNLLDVVGIHLFGVAGAQMPFGEQNRSKGKGAVRLDVSGIQPIGASGVAVQTHLELISGQVTTVQGLVTADGHRLLTGHGIDVHKGQVVATLNTFDGDVAVLDQQVASVIVGDGDGNGVNVGIPLDEAPQQVAALLHREGVGAGLCEGQLVKHHLAVGVVLLLLSGDGITGQGEGELIRGEGVALVFLLGNQVVGHRGGVVEVLECHRGVVVIRGGGQGAVAIIGDGDRDGKHRIVVADAVVLTGVVLHYRVGVDTGGGILDGIKHDAAVGLVLTLGHLLTVLQYTEGELAVGHGSGLLGGQVGKGLVTHQSQGGGTDAVLVGEQRLGGACRCTGTNHRYLSKQLTLGGVGNRHGHMIAAGIGIDTATHIRQVLTQQIIVIALFAILIGQRDGKGAVAVDGGGGNRAGVGDKEVAVGL